MYPLEYLKRVMYFDDEVSAYREKCLDLLSLPSIEVSWGKTHTLKGIKQVEYFNHCGVMFKDSNMKSYLAHKMRHFVRV